MVSPLDRSVPLTVGPPHPIPPVPVAAASSPAPCVTGLAATPTGQKLAMERLGQLMRPGMSRTETFETSLP